MLGAALAAAVIATALTTTFPCPSTCRLVGVPATAKAVELGTGLGGQSIECRVLALAASPRSVFIVWLSASAVGLPPTWMTAGGCDGSLALIAATVPFSGWRT